ncbi:MAG: A/G-specific adenine glycosylase [Wenzhouxiangella sp.]|nr:A/G-specific adenine glycosylase [Wenzhouxiangella sp.]
MGYNIPSSIKDDFASRLLAWWENNGRHDLPWQQDRSLYRVWVSEIMLQQTQVSTVIDYFNRFMARFPNLKRLAEAPLDDILALWSGLGYYARARNLHASARHCMAHHGGELPSSVSELLALPGIGESTAHAIVAQALNRRAPILDGNVKRVLARHAGIEGWPGRSAVLRQLWEEADARTPHNRAADYTQAIMDLGATICTPKQPACMLCPVHQDCIARLEGRTSDLPGKKPKRERPLRESFFLVLRDDSGRVLLERRPSSGIWGGLWCLPEVQESDRPSGLMEAMSTIRHEFTHFSLNMHFIAATESSNKNRVADHQTKWFQPDQALKTGLPRPIRQVMEQLADTIPTP